MNGTIKYRDDAAVKLTSVANPAHNPSMAEIVLFRPPEFYSRHLSARRPPLGLLYLAAELKRHRFKTTVIDTATTPDWQGAVRRAVGAGTIFAGVGVMTGYQIKGALEFARLIKTLGAIPVVWGGLHASLLPEQTIAHDLVDIVVVGEGERASVQIAHCLRDRQALYEVPNLLFKRNGRILSTLGASTFIDLNALPMPDYDQVEVEYYTHGEEGLWGQPLRCLDLNTDRGCPYRCGFCYNLSFNQRRWRCMGADQVLIATTRLVEKYRLQAINFVGDNFGVNADRVQAICEGIICRGLSLKWHMDIRIDTFLRFSNELLKLLKRSGCHCLTFGVESGAQRILDLIKKDLRVKDVFVAHQRAKAMGFAVNYHFMIGLPDETQQDILQTLRLICRLIRDPHVYIFGPSIYIPYPGTPLYERSMALGFKPPQDLESWVSYDWQNRPKLPWQACSYRRYLNDIQFVVEQTTAVRRKQLPGKIIKAYFRIRLWSYAHGFALKGLDVALFRLLRAIFRAAGNRAKP